MIDKALENRIKKVNEFIQLWASFYEKYKHANNQQVFTEEDEKSFLELKSSLARKYQGLMDSLGLKPTAEDRTFDVISQVMSLKSIAMLSPLQMEKLENDWHHSYITLNKVMGSLENQKQELGKINVFEQRCKRILTNPFVALALIIIAISFIYYVLKNFFS
ncbi:MAG: hypothetical protein PHO30_01630 [Candidatus Omnitrophica bacterium]|nr:hypothetical protein [Candidatus Omnitrophota bacterium]